MAEEERESGQQSSIGKDAIYTGLSKGDFNNDFRLTSYAYKNYLFKRGTSSGSFSNQRKRFFILYATGYLLYFKSKPTGVARDKEGKNYKGTICLHNAKCDLLPEGPVQQPYELRLRTPIREYLLMAESAQALTDWNQQIHDVVLQTTKKDVATIRAGKPVEPFDMDQSFLLNTKGQLKTLGRFLMDASKNKGGSQQEQERTVMAQSMLDGKDPWAAREDEFGAIGQCISQVSDPSSSLSSKTEDEDEKVNVMRTRFGLESSAQHVQTLKVLYQPPAGEEDETAPESFRCLCQVFINTICLETAEGEAKVTFPGGASFLRVDVSALQDIVRLDDGGLLLLAGQEVRLAAGPDIPSLASTATDLRFYARALTAPTTEGATDGEPLPTALPPSVSGDKPLPSAAARHRAVMRGYLENAAGKKVWVLVMPGWVFCYPSPSASTPSLSVRLKDCMAHAADHLTRSKHSLGIYFVALDAVCHFFTVPDGHQDKQPAEQWVNTLNECADEITYDPYLGTLYTMVKASSRQYLDACREVCANFKLEDDESLCYYVTGLVTDSHSSSFLGSSCHIYFMTGSLCYMYGKKDQRERRIVKYRDIVRITDPKAMIIDIEIGDDGDKITFRFTRGRDSILRLLIDLWQFARGKVPHSLLARPPCPTAPSLFMAVKAGWLDHIENDKWVTSWCALAGNTFFLFESPIAVTPKAIVVLDNCLSISADHITSARATFAVLFSNAESHFFRGLTFVDRDDWVDLLNHQHTQMRGELRPEIRTALKSLALFPSMRDILGFARFVRDFCLPEHDIPVTITGSRPLPGRVYLSRSMLISDPRTGKPVCVCFRDVKAYEVSSIGITFHMMGDTKHIITAGKELSRIIRDLVEMALGRDAPSLTSTATAAGTEIIKPTAPALIAPLWQGYLEQLPRSFFKNGGSGRRAPQWQRRWVVLAMGYLFIFADRTSSEPLEAVELEECWAAPTDTLLSGGNEHLASSQGVTFGVFFMSKKSHFFRCAAAATRAEWLGRINLVVPAMDHSIFGSLQKLADLRDRDMLTSVNLLFQDFKLSDTSEMLLKRVQFGKKISQAGGLSLRVISGPNVGDLFITTNHLCLRQTDGSREKIPLSSLTSPPSLPKNEGTLLIRYEKQDDGQALQHHKLLIEGLPGRAAVARLIADVQELRLPEEERMGGEDAFPPSLNSVHPTAYAAMLPGPWRQWRGVADVWHEDEWIRATLAVTHVPTRTTRHGHPCVDVLHVYKDKNDLEPILHADLGRSTLGAASPLLPQKVGGASVLGVYSVVRHVVSGFAIRPVSADALTALRTALDPLCQLPEQYQRHVEGLIASGDSLQDQQYVYTAFAGLKLPPGQRILSKAEGALLPTGERVVSEPKDKAPSDPANDAIPGQLFLLSDFLAFIATGKGKRRLELLPLCSLSGMELGETQPLHGGAEGNGRKLRLEGSRPGRGHVFDPVAAAAAAAAAYQDRVGTDDDGGTLNYEQGEDSDESEEDGTRGDALGKDTSLDLFTLTFELVVVDVPAPFTSLLHDTTLAQQNCVPSSVFSPGGPTAVALQGEGLKMGARVLGNDITQGWSTSTLIVRHGILFIYRGDPETTLPGPQTFIRAVDLHRAVASDGVFTTGAAHSVTINSGVVSEQLVRHIEDGDIRARTGYRCPQLPIHPPPQGWQEQQFHPAPPAVLQLSCREDQRQLLSVTNEVGRRSRPPAHVTAALRTLADGADTDKQSQELWQEFRLPGTPIFVARGAVVTGSLSVPGRLFIGRAHICFAGSMLASRVFVCRRLCTLAAPPRVSGGGSDTTLTLRGGLLTAGELTIPLLPEMEPTYTAAEKTLLAGRVAGVKKGQWNLDSEVVVRRLSSGRVVHQLLADLYPMSLGDNPPSLSHTTPTAVALWPCQRAEVLLRRVALAMSDTDSVATAGMSGSGPSSKRGLMSLASARWEKVWVTLHRHRVYVHQTASSVTPLGSLPVRGLECRITQLDPEGYEVSEQEEDSEESDVVAAPAPAPAPAASASASGAATPVPEEDGSTATLSVLFHSNNAMDGLVDEQYEFSDDEDEDEDEDTEDAQTDTRAEIYLSAPSPGAADTLKAWLDLLHADVAVMDREAADRWERAKPQAPPEHLPLEEEPLRVMEGVSLMARQRRKATLTVQRVLDQAVGVIRIEPHRRLLGKRLEPFVVYSWQLSDVEVTPGPKFTTITFRLRRPDGEPDRARFRVAGLDDGEVKELNKQLCHLMWAPPLDLDALTRRGEKKERKEKAGADGKKTRKPRRRRK